MLGNIEEINRREEAALTAIKRVFGTEDDEFGATLFVLHHLEEIDKDYWQVYLDTATPEPLQILDIIELRSHWAEEDEQGIDNFDFTLPGEVTESVISVHFNKLGQAEEVSMAS